MLLATAVAVLHGAVVAFLLTGSLVALRWPRVLWAHLPVTLAVLGLYVTNSACPLTTWELGLREAAGQPRYRGGFIGHYVTEPMGVPIEAASTQVGIYAVAFGVNLLGYALLMSPGRRARSGARPDPTAAASRRSHRRPPEQPSREPDRPPAARGSRW